MDDSDDRDPHHLAWPDGSDETGKLGSDAKRLRRRIFPRRPCSVTIRNDMLILIHLHDSQRTKRHIVL